MVGRYYTVSEYIQDISYLPPQDKDFPANRTVEDFLCFAGTDKEEIKSKAKEKSTTSRPEINLVLLDWDGTVGESYNELGKCLRTLIAYICQSRKIAQPEVLKIMDYECKRREYFGFEDFFSSYGVARILASPFLAKKELSSVDEAFIQGAMNKDLHNLYASFYPSVRTFLKEMQKQGIDVLIFTDTPISEQIDKMTAAGVIGFRENTDGTKELSECLISGLSARDDIHKRPRPEAEIKALEGAGKIIVSSYHVKPHTEAMDKIKAALAKQGKEIKPENILVIGDSLNRDALFALACKTQFLFVCFPSWRTTFGVSIDFSDNHQETFNPEIFRKLKETPKSPIEENHQPLFENYHHEMAIFDYECLTCLYDFRPREACSILPNQLPA